MHLQPISCLIVKKGMRKKPSHEIEFIIDLTAKGFNLTLKHEISILASFGCVGAQSTRRLILEIKEKSTKL